MLYGKLKLQYGKFKSFRYILQSEINLGSCIKLNLVTILIIIIYARVNIKIKWKNINTILRIAML